MTPAFRGLLHIAQDVSVLADATTPILRLSRAQRRFIQRSSRSHPAPVFHVAFARLGDTQRRSLSSNSGKPPAKGFEKFHKQNRSNEPVETKPGEASKPEAPPSELPKGEKSGEAAEPKAEPAEAQSKRPGEGTSGESSEAGAKGEPKAESKKGESDSSQGSSQGSPFDFGQLTPQHMAGIAAGVVSFLWYNSASSQAADRDMPEITRQEMTKNYLAKGYVEKIQIVNHSTCRVHLNNSAPLGEPRVLQVTMGNMELFEAKMEMMQYELGINPLDQVPVQYITETDWSGEFFKVLPYAVLIGGLIFMSRGMASGVPGAGGPSGPGGRNMFTIGKAFPAGKKDLKSKTRFGDVAGQRQAKQEVTEFVDFLRDPSKFEALGAKIPKGGLLVGPPGTGKTLLAKAVAGEADVPFYSMSGSDFVEMFVGVGPSRVRDLFKQARENAPSIIFIDEIDAVGKKRGSGAGGNDERENTLNQMLVEMDGFATSQGVVVLAGTNRADTLDPALTRPGRFDRQIAIERPDLSDREEIFMVHLKPVKLGDELSMESVAKRMAALTPGFSGADIANICNEAAIFAARRSSHSVEQQDFERACERIIGGMTKNNNLMGEKQKRTVALHESGHALVGWFLEGADPLLKVSIIPRSNGALGFAQYLPEELALHQKESLLDKMAVTLGGRAAEELFTDTITTGASDDLDKVTKMAYSMVTVYGMNSEIGLVSYRENAGSEFYKPYSDDTGRKIDKEARALINEQYERTKVLLLEKQDLLKALADKLFEKETLVYKDIHEVLGDRPFAVNPNYEKFVIASGEAEPAVDGTDQPTEAEQRALDDLAGSGAQLAAKGVEPSERKEN